MNKKRTKSRKSKSTKKGGRIFASNKKAFYDYEILEKYEAGIVLTGAEVKSIKNGLASLKESFVHVDDDEIWLWNCHISQWPNSSDSSYDPTRRRKLLLKRREIDKIEGIAKQRGYTLIPLRMYGKRGMIKVEFGLGRGKKRYDKRRQEKERTLKKELHEKKRQFMV